MDRRVSEKLLSVQLSPSMYIQSTDCISTNSGISPRTIPDVRQQAENTAPPDRMTPPAMITMRRKDNPPAE